MHRRHRLFWVLLLGAAGCAQIIDADGLYVFVDGHSSGGSAGEAGAGGGVGGMGGPECTTNDDCAPSGNACKVTSCSNGICKTQNMLEGMQCMPGSPMVCDGQGACVECTFAEHCVGIAEDQCTKRACEGNTCQTKYLGAESPANPGVQQPGDCKIVVCDGVGGTKTIIDDSDTPDDNNGCTIDTCLNGSAVYTAVVMGAACGLNSYCNATGQCVGCLQPSDCAGTFDFCKQATCIDGVCGVSYELDGKALPDNQTAHDCFVVVCDGAGNTVTKVDQTDVPMDGNACTQDLCGTDGTPSHSPEPASTPCGDGVNDICDDFGTCKQSNGKPCTSANECSSGYCVDGVCCDSACDAACSACNVSPMTTGACTAVPLGQDDVNAGLPCTGNSLCDGNGACKKENGQPCATSSECFQGFCADGYCCENDCSATCKACNLSGSHGTCGNIPKLMQDNAATTTCNGTQACDGAGVCKLANGQYCTASSQCASGYCKNAQHKCQ